MASILNYLHIQASPEVCEEIFAAIADKDAGPGSIDFDTIAPMPAWLKRSDPYVADEQREWCRQNWGCEMNALDPDRSANAYDGGPGIYFITKDADVRQLMCNLTKMYPDIYMDYVWAQHDVDKGAGALQFCSGEQTASYMPEPGTREAYELAFDILNATPGEYGLVFDPDLNNYTWKGGERHGRRANR